MCRLSSLKNTLLDQKAHTSDFVLFRTFAGKMTQSRNILLPTSSVVLTDDATMQNSPTLLM